MKKLVIIIVCMMLMLSTTACAKFANPGDSLGGGGTVNEVPNTPEADDVIEDANTVDVSDSDAEKVTTWADGEATFITFSPTGAPTVTGVATSDCEISEDNTTVTVNYSSVGTFVLSGKSSNGRVVFNKAQEYHIVLNGLDLTSATSAPLSIMKKANRVLTLAEGTVNSLTDASVYTYFDSDDEPNAALFSKRSLTINGTGSLTVNGNNNNGIGSKGTLKILSGTITVSAANNALKGNDAVILKGGTLNLTSDQDGIKSDAEDDAGNPTGYIYMENTVLSVTAKEDAVQAAKLLRVVSGTYTVSTYGGAAANTSSNSSSSNRPGWGWNEVTTDDDTSRKGLKSDVNILIEGGTFNIDTYDDAVHSNDTIIVSGSTFAVKSGDDAFHADSYLFVNGGDINITKCYEGLEAAKITVNAGNISIVSSDDGINAADGSQTTVGVSNPNCAIIINGGTIEINASGDGIDSNGTVVIYGGMITVHGPSSGADAALDSDGGILVEGGTLTAAGTLGMVETPAKNSSQNVVSIAFSSAHAAGTEITLQDASGEIIVSYTAQKSFQSLIISSPEIKNGSSYTIYSGTTKISTFTVSSIITSIGSSNSSGSGMGRPR